MLVVRDTASKVQTVLSKNTFFFADPRVQERQEHHISSLVQSILLLKSRIDDQGLKSSLLVEFITGNPLGLNALLAILGLSDETLNRLLQLVKQVNEPQLNRLANLSSWPSRAISVKELPELVKENRSLAQGLVNILLEAATVPVLRNILPLYELKKFDLSKFRMSPEAMVDTIVRYKVKGSFVAQGATNAERFIKDVLTDWGIKWEDGKSLRGLIGRDVDVMIPSKKTPIIVIECSYLVTTSSGMGDKAQAVINAGEGVKRHFGTGVHFIGFVDGFGWYMRKSDLRVIVAAFDDVFTVHHQEMDRFKAFLQSLLTTDCYQ